MPWPCLPVVVVLKKHIIMVVVVNDCGTVNADKCRLCLPHTVKKVNLCLNHDQIIYHLLCTYAI